jgi:hypothetical protein
MPERAAKWGHRGHVPNGRNHPDYWTPPKHPFCCHVGTMFLFGTVVRSGLTQSRSAQFPGSFPGVNGELFQGFMACSRGILIQGQQVLAKGSNGQDVRGENAFEKSIAINLDENKKTNIRILLGTITPYLVHPRTVSSFVFFWRKANPTALSHTNPQPQSRSTCYKGRDKDNKIPYIKEIPSKSLNSIRPYNSRS